MSDQVSEPAPARQFILEARQIIKQQSAKLFVLHLIHAGVTKEILPLLAGSGHQNLLGTCAHQKERDRSS